MLDVESGFGFLDGFRFELFEVGDFVVGPVEGWVDCLQVCKHFVEELLVHCADLSVVVGVVGFGVVELGGFGFGEEMASHRPDDGLACAGVPFGGVACNISH